MMFTDLDYESRGTKVTPCGFYAASCVILYTSTYYFVLCKHKYTQKESGVLSVGYFKLCALAQTTIVHAHTTHNVFVEIMDYLCTGWI